jgi:hypothetical protein
MRAIASSVTFEIQQVADDGQFHRRKKPFLCMLGDLIATEFWHRRVTN